MPQLNPGPWLWTLVATWLTLLVMLKPNILFTCHPITPTTTNLLIQPTHWMWPWP